MTVGALDAGELRVRIVSDTGNLDRDVAAKVDSAGRSAMRSADKSSRNIAASMNRAGNVATLGLTLPLLALGKAAKDAASDVVEGQNKANVVFGESVQAVNRFADSAAKLGIAKSDALAAASGFGALFTTMGIGQPVAAKMSTTLTKLGADMASFSNASPEEALQALQSGLNGESEPLRRFGVFLNEDRVALEAFALGLAKPEKNLDKIARAGLAVEEAIRKVATVSAKYGADSLEARKATLGVSAAQERLAEAMKGTKPKLTEAQKAQARYSLILKDTKLAQGDVERSAKTSAAVQESIAKAQSKNAQASLGKALIPLSIAASQAIGKVAGAFNTMSPAGQRSVLVTAGLLAALGPLIKVGTSVYKVYGLITKALKSERAAKIASAVASKVTAAAQWLLNAAMSANPIMLVVIAIAALVAGLVLAYRHSETFRRIVQAAFGAIMGVVRAVMPVLAAMWQNFLDGVGVVRTVLSVLVALAITSMKLFAAPFINAAKAVGKVFGVAFSAVSTLIRGYIAAWTAIVRTLARLLSGPVGAARDVIVAAFRTAARVVGAVIDGIRATVVRVFGLIVGPLTTIGSAITRALTGAFDAMKAPVLAVARFIRGVLNRIIGAINRVSIKVPKVDLPFGGSVGGQEIGFNIPEIPSFGDGGYVKYRRGGLLARIAEKRDEVVMPADELAAAGRGAYFAEGAIKVYNPAPEPASASVHKRLRRLAVMGVVA